MHVQALGHVVLKVRDLERSEIFYSDLLGMRVVSRISNPPMTFFRIATSDNHHDFALMELSPHATTKSSSDQNVIGLAHVAFKIGRSVEELRQARSELDASGTRCLYEADRAFAKSVHVLDPDGNEVELYVETLGHSEGWPERQVNRIQARLDGSLHEVPLHQGEGDRSPMRFVCAAILENLSGGEVAKSQR